MAAAAISLCCCFSRSVIACWPADFATVTSPRPRIGVSDEDAGDLCHVVPLFCSWACRRGGASTERLGKSVLSFRSTRQQPTPDPRLEKSRLRVRPASAPAAWLRRAGSEAIATFSSHRRLQKYPSNTVEILQS